MKNIKIAAVLTLGMCLLFTSCKAGGTVLTDIDPSLVLQGIPTLRQSMEGMSFLTPADAVFVNYISDNYGLDAGVVEDGVIYYAGGANPDEAAVFLLNDASETESVENALLAYIDERIELFYGYMPEAVETLEDAIVSVAGNYVALFVCDFAAEAEEQFLLVLREGYEPSGEVEVSGETEISAPEDSETQSTPKNGVVPAAPDPPVTVSHEYDRGAIVDAWFSGDDSYLSEKNRQILKTAGDVIDEVITDGMSEYDKELALHDWIVDWGEYDIGTLSWAPETEPNPDNDNPYGLLIDRVAICSGYTETFQLFMDLAGIECVTVRGSAYSEDNEHAWNMVNLDGEWYCVDVTWNDPVTSYDVGESTKHEYFNVTSEYMLVTEHFWDESAVPEAEGEAYAWRPE